MYTTERKQLSGWFITDPFLVESSDLLRETCRTFLKPLALASGSPLLAQLASPLDADLTDQDQVNTNWSVVLAELTLLFPEPPALREALLRYLSGVLAFLKKAADPCGEWLHSAHQTYRLLESPAEQAAFLNLFLEKPVPTHPCAWLKAASTPLGDWLPLALLSGGSEEMTSLATVLLAGAQLIENQQLQPDLDYLLGHACIARFTNQYDQVEQDLYHTLQQQCDALANLGLNSEHLACYYSQVRLFFSTRGVFTTWHEADQALKELIELGDVSLVVVPSSYRQDLLRHALTQVTHHGGPLALCETTGLPLWQDGEQRWQTVSRDPVVRQQVASGSLPPLMDNNYVGLSHYCQLHPQVIRDWYLPGQLELAIADAARAAGWTVTLWPKRDQVDVLCEHPDASLALAIDGKDWRNGYLLGRSFDGFKSYEDGARYLGLVVVPDYQLIRPRYREQFMGGQAYQRRQARLLDVSEFRRLVKHLGAVGEGLLPLESISNNKGDRA